MDKIEGGFYIKARQTQKSWISNAPPHVREIWDWILLNANFKSNDKIKRGQLLTTYKDIQDGLSWFVGYRKHTYKKHHCEIAMKALTRERMIATKKTTRGLIITVLNYCKYQNPKNYECYNEQYNKTTTTLQPTDTIRKEREESKKGNKEGGKNDKRFTPPSLEEVFQYCTERENNVDADQWYDFYESKGWMVGKNKMKDWKAAVRTWEKRKNQSQKQNQRDAYAEELLNEAYNQNRIEHN